MKKLSSSSPKLLKNDKKKKVYLKDTIKQTPLQKAKTGLVYVLLILWAIFILLPILGVFLASFNTANENYLVFDARSTASESLSRFLPTFA